MSVLVISYSRPDRKQVRSLVSLLKSAFRELKTAVFWDEDLEPGEPWFEQLKHHIDASPQLFVFWCVHAAGSMQVRREFLYAFEQQKRVVPVLLDDTPLSPELAPIHGIDLRGVIAHVDDEPRVIASPTKGDDPFYPPQGVRPRPVPRRAQHIRDLFAPYLAEP